MSATLTALEQDALTETYEDVKKFVYSIAHRFARQRNVDFEELRGVADYYFVKAYHSYNPRSGAKLITWVGFVVYKQLQTYLKRTHRHRYYVELNEEIVGVEDHNDFMLRLRTELDEDANFIVNLLVEAPEDMRVLMKWRTKGHKVVTKRTVINVLTEHLQDIGWTRQRIAESFEEIRWVLSRRK